MPASAPALSQCNRFESLRVSSYSRPAGEAEKQAYEDLIRRLIARRMAIKVTQAQLDHELGVSEGQVAKWESFSRLPGMFMMVCWCRALRVVLVPVDMN